MKRRDFVGLVLPLLASLPFVGPALADALRERDGVRLSVGDGSLTELKRPPLTGVVDPSESPYSEHLEFGTRLPGGEDLPRHVRPRTVVRLKAGGRVRPYEAVHVEGGGRVRPGALDRQGRKRPEIGISLSDAEEGEPVLVELTGQEDADGR